GGSGRPLKSALRCAGLVGACSKLVTLRHHWRGKLNTGPDWRNWQTRRTQNALPSGVGVQVPHPARYACDSRVRVDQRSRVLSMSEQSTTRRVVVAEDESLIRLDIVETLRDNGFDVVGEAGDGEEALRLVEELQPDLVVMDVKMPKLDGISAAEKITSAP